MPTSIVAGVYYDLPYFIGFSSMNVTQIFPFTCLLIFCNIICDW